MLEEFIAIDATDSTTDKTSREFLNDGARGILLLLTVTSAGTGELDGLELMVALGTGSYKKMYTLAATSNVGSNGSYLFMLYPQTSLNATDFAGTPVIGTLPRRFKIVTSHANANAMTYKVYYQLLK